jgi:YidC/Oxa1 family membrane protein insertase
MPLFFLYLFSSFPAGLVIYWTWSNLLTIAQQWIQSKLPEPEDSKKVSKKIAK